MANAIETYPEVWAGEGEQGWSTRLRRTWATWRRKPLGVIGAVIIFLLFLLAVTAPYLAPYDGAALVGRRLEEPSSAHLFGTDVLGRDVFSRVIYGAQISMVVGLTATFIGISTGTILGIVSGYAGGWLDLIVQRVLEVLASFPNLVLILILVAVLGRSDAGSTNLLEIAWNLRTIEIAIAIAFIFGVMRVIRSAVLRESALPYIEAARSIGVPTSRLLWRHILPNVMPLVVVSFSAVIGAAILIEASLSFLGFGVSTSTPSWGSDLSARNREFFVTAPWLLAAPGIALSLTVLGYNFLGDALRDVMDPRLRGTR
jgi:peptide/nickel transport system permease protein